MKKFLLIAAMAALALGASAQDYKLEKVWEINDVSFLPTLDSRQGFGMNGKFYINNKKQSVDTVDGVEIVTVPTIYEVDENGLTGVTYDGGRNCAITHDEAGNIITSNAGFGSTMWNEQSFTVFNPETGETKTFIIPNDTGLQGRCDFFGFPKGNLLEDGELYITAATSDGATYTDKVLRIKITDGELDTDNTYVATCDGLVNPQSSTVINYYVDKDGNDALVYAYRSGNPAKLVADGDNFSFTSIVLPNLDDVNKKGHANGVFPLIWDGKEMFIYPLMPDYRDGWAIAEAGAAEPLLAVTATASANCNGFQCNWLNAEVDATGVTIYQYAPGYCLRVWRLTKEEEPEAPNVYILGEVNGNAWAPNVGVQMTRDEENNVYTATITTDGMPDGYSYFSFSTELAMYDDQGSWDYIKPFRFGAVTDGNPFLVSEDQIGNLISLEMNEEPNAFQIPAGEWNLTLSYDEMTLIIKKVAPDVMRGDVNDSGDVRIDDVTALIDYLLGGSADEINFANADCNLDGYVKVDDVTVLIDFLLGGTWEE